MEPEGRISKTHRWFRCAIAAYLFVLVLALTPWTPDPAGDIKRLLLALFSASLAVAWLATTWRFGVPVRRPRIALEVLLGMLICYGAATLRSPYPGYSVTELAFFGALFLLYFVATQVYTLESEVLALMRVLCIAVALAAVYGLCQKFGLDPFPWTDRDLDIYTNLPSTFGNPNYAAHTLVLALIMAVALGLQRGGRWTWALAALFAVHLYFTGQRGGIIGLAAAVLLLLVARGTGLVFSSAIKRVVTAIVVTAIVGVAAGGLYMAQNKARNGVALPLDSSLLLRYNGYLNAAAMVREHPLLGHGPGVFAITTPKYWTTFEQQWFAQEQRLNAHVHNDIFEVAVDAGLPAAGFYLAVLLLATCFGLLTAFTAATRTRRRLGYAFAALFLTFLVDGLFGFNLRVPVSASILFLMLGALEGLWARAPAAAAPGRVPALAGTAWRLGVAASAVLIVLWGGRGFLAELQNQRGLKHHYKLLQVLSAPPEEQREMDPQKAAAYVTAQRDAAVSAFLWGEGLTPWNHQFAGRIGATLAAVQDYDEAVRHLERALERNPYHVPTLARLVGTRLAQAEAEMNQEPGEAAPTANPDRLLDDATRHADRMIALCPYFPIAEELKARILCLRAQSLARRDPPADRVEIEEQWRAAEAHFERAIELGAKNHIELYRFLAQVRDVLGDLEGEEEALVRAAQANPGDGALWNVFFDFAMRAEPSERLQSTLTMMIAHIANLDPPRHDAVAKGYMALARLATESRDFPRAEAAFANAARYGTEEASVWTAFAQYAHRRKRLAFFEECLGEAVRRVKETGVLTHPALAVAHLLLAEIQESQQPPVDPAIIDAAYQQAVQFAPDRPDVWSNYANFARKQDRMDALKETVTTSCRAALENGLTPLAYVRAVNDVLEEGPVALEVATETLLRQFREYPPDNARLAAVHLTWAAQLLLEAAVAAQDGDVPLCMTWLNLAIVLAGIEQYPVAEGLYPRAMQCLEGENVAVGGMQWADTLQRMGRMPEAINLLRDLLVRFPDMPDVRHACAQALARNRQIPEALQEYDVLLDVPYLPPNIVQQLEAEREALLQQQP